MASTAGFRLFHRNRSEGRRGFSLAISVPIKIITEQEQPENFLIPASISTNDCLLGVTSFTQQPREAHSLLEEKLIRRLSDRPWRTLSRSSASTTFKIVIPF